MGKGGVTWGGGVERVAGQGATCRSAGLWTLRQNRVTLVSDPGLSLGRAGVAHKARGVSDQAGQLGPPGLHRAQRNQEEGHGHRPHRVLRH